MNNLRRAIVWLSRVGHCRGFGIQSPTDYAFVRYVINEHWPYYAYDQLGGGDWLRRKQGRLCFRLANWRQPTVIVDQTGQAEYLQAGCRRARIVPSADTIQLACLPVDCDYQSVLARCDSRSVVYFHDIWQQPRQWRAIVADPRSRITYDLYYCGIALFDPQRTKQHYIINF
jgi:hypothetical protein